ncbi:GTPase HflX [Patescibacteria group bacterium]|nr:GTPase HflX [Patescibacteria group bacterium]MCL5091954.1 GTPase HflX [Patescibacteria group bacterium]
MNHRQRVVLLDIADPHIHRCDALKNLEELQALVKTYGGTEATEMIQHRTRPDPSTFIGRGKIQPLKEIVKQQAIDVVIVNAVVNHGQLFRLTQALWPANRLIKVWDRIDLILHIFDRHARTAAAKLQIEVARMRHMGPRIYGLGGSFFSRQAGGIGTRGLGETNIELMKRHWRNQIKKKTDQLRHLLAHHQRQMDQRHQNGIRSVAIVGYTNAGKTSLFNLLTGKTQFVKNALFITLDSVSGRLYLPRLDQKVVISDTIGFIQNLPPSLIDAFRSTLFDSMNADLLLQVIDAADQHIEEKIETVNRLLQEINQRPKKQLFVFNKADCLNQIEQRQLMDNYHYLEPVMVSVKKKIGIQSLINKIERSL